MTPLTLQQLEEIARLVRAFGVEGTTATVRASTDHECRSCGEPYLPAGELADGRPRMITVLLSPTTMPGRQYIGADGQERTPR